MQDLRVITWCPRCETALALAEIDYENKEDPSIYVKFPLIDVHPGLSENTYVLVWTTTPWTLPANMAVCVHPEYDYAYVKVGEETYLLAEALADSIFGGSEYEIIEVDSNSQEETRLMMKEHFSDVKFFPFSKNVGFQALVKKGYEMSLGKYIL